MKLEIKDGLIHDIESDSYFSVITDYNGQPVNYTDEGILDSNNNMINPSEWFQLIPKEKENKDIILNNLTKEELEKVSGKIINQLNKIIKSNPNTFEYFNPKDFTISFVANKAIPVKEGSSILNFKRFFESKKFKEDLDTDEVELQIVVNIIPTKKKESNE